MYIHSIPRESVLNSTSSLILASFRTIPRTWPKVPKQKKTEHRASFICLGMSGAGHEVVGMKDIPGCSGVRQTRR